MNNFYIKKRKSEDFNDQEEASCSKKTETISSCKNVKNVKLVYIKRVT